MKVAILAGGRGSRLAEETEVRPKPMVEIGNRPILWHIMRYFSHFGLSQFVVALGYRSDHIKSFFSEYHMSAHSLRVDLTTGQVEALDDGQTEKWTVELIETGMWTNTGGRIKRLRPHLGDETFMLAYGDGLYDVDLNALIEFHRSHGRLLTVTAVHPPPRFGQLVIHDDQVVELTDRPIETGWINGALFVCEPGIFEYIDGDANQFENEPIDRLLTDDQLMAYRHEGFWQCMDTLRDKVALGRMWKEGRAPWKVWA